MFRTHFFFFSFFFFFEGLFKTHLYNNFQHNKYFKRLINSRKKINVHNGKLMIFFLKPTNSFIHSYVKDLDTKHPQQVDTKHPQQVVESLPSNTFHHQLS